MIIVRVVGFVGMVIAVALAMNGKWGSAVAVALGAIAFAALINMVVVAAHRSAWQTEVAEERSKEP